MNPQVPTDFSYFPVQASTVAKHVDDFYIAMVLLSTFFCIAIPAAIIYFAIKYRHRPGNDRPRHVETSTALEMTWTIIPFFLVIGMFVWGSRVYFMQVTQDPNAMEILVTGKKWMWKFQHRNGHREIQDLHIPVNTPIRLKMASEDVIHAVFIPAFRVKQDVMPGRYTYLNFTANRTGVYHLFCNQYCGTSHSGMIGKVVVMEPGDYQKWLGGYTGDPPEKVGEALFTSLACNTCHTGDTGSRGPLLNGLAGSQVALQGGNIVTADDNYLRESILNPQAKIVAGYQPIMPDFQGVVSTEQVNALIAYIKTLPAGGDTQPEVSTAAVGTSEGTVAPRPEVAPTEESAAEQTLPGENQGQVSSEAQRATELQSDGAATPDAAAPANNQGQQPAEQTPAPAEPAPAQPADQAAPQETNATPTPNNESSNAATTAGETPAPTPAVEDGETSPGEQQGVQ